MRGGGVPVGAEHDVGWVEGEIVELGVGSEIGDSTRGYGADPADRARDNASFEWIVWQAMISLAGFVEHVGCKLRPSGSHSCACVVNKSMLCL